ncbi:MAG TPA: hypothetical protein DIS76_02705, partial [Rhodospirillaceae bacterium]|nr:hypothetical protein [Rhodospirillaceae bacterium]
MQGENVYLRDILAATNHRKLRQMEQIMQLSEKGQKLIGIYAQMVTEGYTRKDGEFVAEAFNDFELRPYRAQLKTIMSQFQVETVLDYGSGGAG